MDKQLSVIDNQRSLRFCIMRLKRLSDSPLPSDGDSVEVAKATLRGDLVDVIRILERIQDNTKSSLADGEDFNVSGYNEDARTQPVPNEVRDWLQMTFRRSPPPQIVTAAPPKFRTVARAVRMSLSAFNRQSPCSSVVLPPKASDFVKKYLNDWTFDVFKLNEITEGHALRATATCLFERYALANKFRIAPTTLDCFLLNLEKGYSKHDNPYHNLMHAADVAQTMHFFVQTYNLTEWLTDLQILAAIIAALIHDYEHNGTTNNFHVNSKSDLALFYNDRAVLENHHASAAFRMMQCDESNILSDLPPEDYRSVRTLVIDMVLATEMKAHLEQLKTMKTSLALNSELDRPSTLGFLLHVADVAHPAKEWSIHRRWALLILDEFFKQGDLEKAMNLPVSPLCDRQTTLIPHSQIGFIDCVVSPVMTIVGDLFEWLAVRKKSSSSTLLSTDEEPVERERERERVTDGELLEKNKSNTLQLVSKPWDSHLQFNKQRWKEEA